MPIQKSTQKGQKHAVMELKEFTEKTLSLFGVDNPEQLGNALMSACNDTEKLTAFKTLVGEDLTKDWMQMIYQYYLADRDVKKQDYTPPTVAKFMGMLAGGSDRIVDMCAGSGALIIQKWNQNKDARFTAIEFDENVIPFLIFNMVLRNIRCRVFHMDALKDEPPMHSWDVMKGEEYGHVTDIKSALQHAT